MALQMLRSVVARATSAESRRVGLLVVALVLIDLMDLVGSCTGAGAVLLIPPPNAHRLGRLSPGTSLGGRIRPDRG